MRQIRIRDRISRLFKVRGKKEPPLEEPIFQEIERAEKDIKLAIDLINRPSKDEKEIGIKLLEEHALKNPNNKPLVSKILKGQVVEDKTNPTETREYGIQVLATLGEGDYLARLFNKEKEGTIRGTILVEMAKNKHKEIEPLIKQAIQSRDSEILPKALLSARVYSKEFARLISNEISDIFHNSNDPKIRLEALKTLISAERGDIIQHVLEKHDLNDREVIKTAIQNSHIIKNPRDRAETLEKLIDRIKTQIKRENIKNWAHPLFALKAMAENKLKNGGA